MKKILIMSDTHGDYVFYKNIIAKEKADLVVHAGDFCIEISEMKKNFDFFVAGNNDYEGERIVNFQYENLNFQVMHGDQFGSSIFEFKKREEKIWQYAKDNKIDVLINGHTHIESFLYKDNIMVINPGSLSLPRNSIGKKSYAILYIENKKIINLEFEKIFKYID